MLISDRRLEGILEVYFKRRSDKIRMVYGIHNKRLSDISPVEDGIDMGTRPSLFHK